MTEAVKS
jgi:hypothetical protein